MTCPEIGHSGRPLRIGVVKYLNSQPLCVGLDRLDGEVELTADVPSRLAQGLADGLLDVALVPSIEMFGPGGYEIVSDACVSCDGPVRSVKLLSRTSMERIESLAVDEGSKTSAALVQILLRERFRLRPRIKRLPIGVSPEECQADAVMLIGDRAMFPPPADFAYSWDLGQEWKAWTGLPFVFALWLARPGTPLQRLAVMLTAARDAGVGGLDEVARREAPSRDLTTEECLDYFRRNLAFHLGPRQREGLARFGDMVRRHGLVASEPARVGPVLKPHLKRAEERVADERLVR